MQVDKCAASKRTANTSQQTNIQQTDTRKHTSRNANTENDKGSFSPIVLSTALMCFLRLLLLVTYPVHPLFMLMSWTNIVMAQGRYRMHCNLFFFLSEDDEGVAHRMPPSKVAEH